MGFHLTDIRISWMELQTALYEAREYQASEHVLHNYYEKMKVTYNAVDIINLKTLFSL